MPIYYLPDEATAVVDLPFVWSSERIQFRDATHWHLKYISLMYILSEIVNFIWYLSVKLNNKDEFAFEDAFLRQGLTNALMSRPLELTFYVLNAIQIFFILVYIFLMVLFARNNNIFMAEQGKFRMRVMEGVSLILTLISLGRTLSEFEKDPNDRALWYFWTSQILLSVSVMSLFVVFNFFNPLLVSPRYLWVLGVLLSIASFRINIKNDLVRSISLVIVYVLHLLHVFIHCKECIKLQWANIMHRWENYIVFIWTTCMSLSGILNLMILNVFRSLVDTTEILVYLVLSTTILLIAVLLPRFLLWREQAARSNAHSQGQARATMLQAKYSKDSLVDAIDFEMTVVDVQAEAPVVAQNPHQHTVPRQSHGESELVVLSDIATSTGRASDVAGGSHSDTTSVHSHSDTMETLESDRADYSRSVVSNDFDEEVDDTSIPLRPARIVES